jgi:hypothetical protein
MFSYVNRLQAEKEREQAALAKLDPATRRKQEAQAAAARLHDSRRIAHYTRLGSFYAPCKSLPISQSTRSLALKFSPDSHPDVPTRFMSEGYLGDGRASENGFLHAISHILRSHVSIANSHKS